MFTCFPFLNILDSYILRLTVFKSRKVVDKTRSHVYNKDPVVQEGGEVSLQELLFGAGGAPSTDQQSSPS